MTTLEDRTEIAELMNGWLHRDLGRWDDLAALFHDDAIIEITWFKGTAAEFVAGSRRMGSSDLTSRHVIGAPMIAMRGNRAFVETPVIIVGQHSTLHLGATTHGRMLDRVEKRGGRWGIVERHCSYDISSFDYPRGAVDIDWSIVDAHPAEYAPLAYLLTVAGYPVEGTFPTRFSSLETKIRSDVDVWLNEEV